MNIRTDHTRFLTRALLAAAAMLALAISSTVTSAAEPDKAPEAAQAHFSLPGAGKTYKREGEIREIKVNAIQSGGRFTIVEGHLSPGSQVPAHYHLWHSETFYVIDGQMEWTVNGETHLLGPGGLVYIPPGAVHSVKVIGDKPAHSLLVATPGGHEYEIQRQQSRTPEERANPEAQKKLMELNDFHLAPAK